MSAWRETATVSFVWKAKRLLRIGTERKFREAIRVVNVLTNDLIHKRRKLGCANGQDLLLWHDDDYLRDIVVNFLLTGRDTIASALTNSLFWLLARHVDVSGPMRDEIDHHAAFPAGAVRLQVLHGGRHAAGLDGGASPLLNELIDVDRDADGVSSFGDDEEVVVTATVSLVWKAKWLLRIGSERKLREAIRVVNVLTNDLIHKRRKLGCANGHDLLLRHDDEYLRDIVVSFLLTGRDTVASALTNSFFWLLARHVEVSGPMREEIDRVLSSGSFPAGVVRLQVLHGGRHAAGRDGGASPLLNQLIDEDGDADGVSIFGGDEEVVVAMNYEAKEDERGDADDDAEASPDL
ncbi:hypothetical protein ZIOFF_052588 [Zingiber officinale]|uniref:Cytochrome P450 n=1 Tax=Zingiber officinale TaxID=94328 RepID=A0A8J5KNJ7_ZINOF|nr:hypothetical protein ZIOFF_052588 [Zingiber officinale]